MSKQSSTPAKLGTVWNVGAQIQVINEATNKWDVLATVIDTPNAVDAKIAELRKAHKGKKLSVWVRHGWGEREYVGTGKCKR